MSALIEGDLPNSWQDLEAQVARILYECGYDVEIEKNVKLARGDVNIDVWADEPRATPPNVIVVECKHWKTPATKNVVHGFRTVVGDCGANTGLIVSSAGFQDGAVEAAAYSNVRLLTWAQFQAMFAERWYRNFMCPRIAEETDPLHEYTEPINSRIFRKADALPEEGRQRFKALREEYLPLAATNFLFNPIVVERLMQDDPLPVPNLPLRMDEMPYDTEELFRRVPDDVLDAAALRPLMEAMIEQSKRGIAEFDEVFGERA